MRKFVTLASVMVLAAGGASCSSSDASNSASNVLPLASPVSPSMLEARGGNGKGGGGGNPDTGSGSSTLSYRILSDSSPAGVSWGDTITFDVFTAETNNPVVDLTCSQNGGVVYSAQWPLTPNLTLSSRAWQSGAADCTATLYYVNYPKNTILASISFVAAG